MSICTGRKEMAWLWMAVLRDGGRWIVLTADTVYQRAAFKCVFISPLPLSQYFLTFGALFDQCLWNWYSLPFPIVLLLLWQCNVYELLHCTHSHKPAAAIIWCLIHVIKPQRHLRALSQGYKRGGVAWSDKTESAHDFNCYLAMIEQMS